MQYGITSCMEGSKITPKFEAAVQVPPNDLKDWDPLAWLSFADEWLSPEVTEAFAGL